jgi:hypothetical protein
VERGEETQTSLADAVDLVVGFLAQAKRGTSEQVQRGTGVDKATLKDVLRGLMNTGKVVVEGKARGTRYVWACPVDGGDAKTPR